MIGARLAMSGEEASGFWRQVYEQHGPAVLAFLRSRARSREDAEDLLQETFVRAIRAGSGLRDSSKIRPSLFATAHNLLRNVHRRTAASPLVDASPTVDPEASDGADSRARVRLLLARLQALLEAMPSALRQAFELGIIEKLAVGGLRAQPEGGGDRFLAGLHRPIRRHLEPRGDRRRGGRADHEGGRSSGSAATPTTSRPRSPSRTRVAQIRYRWKKIASVSFGRDAGRRRAPRAAPVRDGGHQLRRFRRVHPVGLPGVDQRRHPGRRLRGWHAQYPDGQSALLERRSRSSAGSHSTTAARWCSTEPTTSTIRSVASALRTPTSASQGAWSAFVRADFARLRAAAALW